MARSVNDFLDSGKASHHREIEDAWAAVGWALSIRPYWAFQCRPVLGLSQGALPKNLWKKRVATKRLTVNYRCLPVEPMDLVFFYEDFLLGLHWKPLRRDVFEGGAVFGTAQIGCIHFEWSIFQSGSTHKAIRREMNYACWAGYSVRGPSWTCAQKPCAIGETYAVKHLNTIPTKYTQNINKMTCWRKGP